MAITIAATVGVVAGQAASHARSRAGDGHSVLFTMIPHLCQPPRMRRSRHIGILMACLLTGCVTTWQSQPVTPTQLLETTGETEVRVTLTSGTRIVLRDPGVEGDSLIGWLKPSFDATDKPVRQALALGDVRDVAVRKNDLGPNLILGVVAGTALFFTTAIAAWAIACTTQYCD